MEETTEHLVNITQASEFEDEETEQDRENRIRIERIQRIKPHMWKPGQSGNPKGRPDGKSMKEYAKEILAAMSHEQRMEFFQGLPKEVIWRMAEGNPSEDKNIKISVPQPILGGITQQIGDETGAANTQTS